MAAQRALEEVLDHGGDSEAILERLSSAFGVRIVRFVRWSSNDVKPTFDLEIEGCETVRFESVAGITNQKRFCDQVLAATGLVVEPCKKAREWARRVQALFNAREERTTGDDTSDESYAFRLLTQYFDYSNGGADSREKGLAQRKHWVEDGYRYFFIDSFIKWAGVQHSMRYSAKEIGKMLTKRNAENRRLNTQTKDGRHTTVSVWTLRHNYLYEEKVYVFPSCMQDHVSSLVR